jgi:large subunit ribosomal protein L7/L12
MATKTEEVLDKIGEMSVLELSELVEQFKDKFNVTAVAAPVAAAAAGGGEAAEAEKEDYAVILEGIGDKKIQVIKVVRELTGLGLKEAKEVVDGAPSTVKEDVLKDEADQMKAKLEAVGATVALK